MRLSRRSFAASAVAFAAAGAWPLRAETPAIDITVTADGKARVGERVFRCAIGSGGIRADKREGDGATPAGEWPLREVFYRADRIARPKAPLPVRALKRDDGWCDAPADPQYNKPVTLPYPASAENLWRRDRLYDLIVVVGYNDAPVVPGMGSAIFMHVARGDYRATAGCVAFARSDLLKILKTIDARSRLIVRA